jgi:multiple sugar transport system permease protein
MMANEPLALAMTPRQGTRRARQIKTLLVAGAFLAPYTIFFLAFLAIPIFYGFYISLHNWSLFSQNPSWAGFQNYQNLSTDNQFWSSLERTAEFTAITVVLMVIVSLGAALLVSVNLKGQTLYRLIFFAPVVLSVAVVGLVWTTMWNTDIGLVNNLLNRINLPSVEWLSSPNLVIPSLSITTVWWGFGLPMVIFLAGLRSIPAALYDAAYIDGAGPRAAFFHITLPLLRPSMLFVLVTQVIAQFQVFGQPLILTGGGPGTASYTIIMYLYDVAWHFYNLGYGAAIAFALALIMGVITAIQFFFLGNRVEF